MKKSTLHNLINILILISLLGFAASSYLTYTHYLESSEPQVCDINSTFDCSTVNTSSYAELFGIPVAIFGIIWFIIFILLALKTKQSKSHTRPLFHWTIIGLISVLYFIYAEIQLGAICLYCTFVHIFIIISFIISLYLYKQSKK